MSSSRVNEGLHILAECLFAFRFFHMQSPLAGVEFDRLVLNDLQILDSPAPPMMSFLPWLLQTELCVHVLSSLDSSMSASSAPTADRKTEEKRHKLSSSIYSNTWKDSSLWLVCWLCGLFSERVGFEQHIFEGTHKWVHVCTTQIRLACTVGHTHVWPGSHFCLKMSFRTVYVCVGGTALSYWSSSFFILVPLWESLMF